MARFLLMFVVICAPLWAALPACPEGWTEENDSIMETENASDPVQVIAFNTAQTLAGGLCVSRHQAIVNSCTTLKGVLHADPNPFGYFYPATPAGMNLACTLANGNFNCTQQCMSSTRCCVPPVAPPPPPPPPIR